MSFVEHVEKTRSVMRRFDKFFVPGVPKLDEITYFVIPDQSARVAALRAGDVDWIDDVPFQDVQSLKNDPKFTVMQTPSTWIEYLLFRIDLKPWDDQRVRQAFFYATDRQALCQAVSLGLYTPAYSDVPDFSPIPMTWNPIKYDPDKAKQLLADAGLAGGFECTIEVSNSPIWIRLGEVLIDQWGKVGIKAKAHVFDTLAPTWQILISGNTQGYDPDTKLFRNYHSTGSFRFAEWTWKDPKVDQLLEQGRATLDVTERSKIYSQIMQITTDAAVRMPVWQRSALAAMRKGVTGFQLRHDSMPWWDTVDLAA
jgi:peptide/nickel transport system substrate-binding protein